MINRDFEAEEFNSLASAFNETSQFLATQCVEHMELSTDAPGTTTAHFLCMFNWTCQIYLRRMLDLAKHYSDLVNSKDDLAAAIIGRAIVETTAHFHTFISNLNKYLDAERHADAYHLAASHMLGGRHGFDKDIKLKQLHINDSLRHADKSYRGMEDSHGWLCEFVHPNSLGLTAFSEIDKKNNLIIFHDKFQTPAPTPTLDAAISFCVFELDWKKIEESRVKIVTKWKPFTDMPDVFQPGKKSIGP